MLCGYCQQDTQNGEEHTVECYFFRNLSDNSEAKADPYAAFVAAVLAASEFAYREGGKMSREEYRIVRSTVSALKREDPYVDEEAQGQYGRVPL